MSYLVQAAMFLRIRKLLGDVAVKDDENLQYYDVFLRSMSLLHYCIYLLFFMIWFRIELVYL